ncbi:outer membrane protein [Candidatus Jidaibacter acanthamoebae]|nr:outer membrane beta-barrel protein [Candidatus Jidaibacter acanthamoeba]
MNKLTTILSTIALSCISYNSYAEQISTTTTDNLYSKGYVSLGFIGGKGSMKVNNYLRNGPFSIREDGKSNVGMPGIEVALGTYITPEFRGEIAINYLKGANSFITYETPFVGENSEAKAYIKRLDIMLNGYYDFNNDTLLTPYMMVGIGASKNKAELNIYYPYTTPQHSKSKTGLAFQVGTGVESKLTQHLKVGLGYRLHYTPSIKFSNIKRYDASSYDNHTFKYKPAQHLLLANIKFDF